jgi:hypothetical protein
MKGRYVECARKYTLIKTAIQDVVTELAYESDKGKGKVGPVLN